MAIHVKTENGCYFLCGVEGCPRAVESGQDEPCGLSKLVPITAETINDPILRECGAVLNIDHWFTFENPEYPLHDKACSL